MKTGNGKLETDSPTISFIAVRLIRLLLTTLAVHYAVANAPYGLDS
jgi:hypothetical protein